MNLMDQVVAQNAVPSNDSTAISTSDVIFLAPQIFILLYYEDFSPQINLFAFCGCCGACLCVSVGCRGLWLGIHVLKKHMQIVVSDLYCTKFQI